MDNTDDLLRDLAKWRLQVLAAEEHMDATVHDLREAGASWAVIGEAIGVSGSAAHQKWSPQAREKHAARQRRLYKPQPIPDPIGKGEGGDELLQAALKRADVKSSDASS